MLNRLLKPLGGLYKIVVDGIGTYYGESDNIPRRWARHRKQLRNGRHHNVKLRRAYRDLGDRKFHFIIIEQSEVLTASKALRLVAEKVLIRNDPNNLNTAGSQAEIIQGDYLPVHDKYRNKKKLYLERVPRTGLARVRYETKTGMILGLETMDGKFRSGTFSTDANCKLTRLKNDA